MKGEIKIIRFSMLNYPDIIGYVDNDSENENNITVEQPHAIVVSQQSSRSELNLVPYIPGYAKDTNNKISIRKSDVFVTFLPVEELRQKFSAMFGSGLILPSNNTVRVPTAQIGTSLP